jgi:hypothetical protein
MTEHQQVAAGRLRRVLRRGLLKHVDWVVVNGRSARRVITSLGFPESRTAIIHNTCELEPFWSVNPAPGWERVRKLVYVGRLSPEKGLLPMLTALNQVVLRRPDLIVEMSFAGCGPAADELRSISVSERLKVILRGYVPFEQRQKPYRHGNVFVFPSLSDEWGLVVNEAMGSGLPVCGSIYSQAATELVRPGYNGWLFDPFDSASMIHTFESMLSASAAEIARMGRNARESASELAPSYHTEQMLRTIYGVAHHEQVEKAA